MEDSDLKASCSLHWIATSRLRPADDAFFDEGNEACNVWHKHFKQTTSDDEDDSYAQRPSFACQIGQCQKSFTDLTSYESHYHTCHSNVCSACSKVLPTSHLLEIHVLENHDSLFPLLAMKQKMYQCLVATCTEKFGSPEERRKHLMKVHRYPSSFRFERPKKRSNMKTKNAMEVEVTDSSESSQQAEPMEISRKFSYKVPKVICFGKGGSRTFQQKPRRKKHWHQGAQNKNTKVNIEEVHMKDLAQALES